MLYAVNTRSSQLRVRSGPGLGYLVIGSLTKGTRVRVTKKRDPWWQISTGGWVHSDFLIDANSVSAPAEANHIRKMVSQVLQDPVLARINFRYGPIAIRGADYRRVAQAIDVGDVFVLENAQADAEAVYLFEKDTMLVKPGLNFADLLNRSKIVHEATHALQDYYRLRMVNSDVEGSAFVAQWYYVTLKSIALRDLAVRPDNAMGEALGIAQRLCSSPTEQHVSDDEMRRLRQLLPAAGYDRLNSVVQGNGY